MGTIFIAEVVVADMPEDMQDILQSFFDEAGMDLPKTLPTKQISVALFPDVALADGVSDERGQAYAKAMIGEDVPPVVIYGETWLDGRHRVWAAKKSGKPSIEAIDLHGRVPKSAIDVIEPIGTLLQGRSSVTDTAAFRTWFGDSKMVFGSGQPIVAYHGTRREFTEFRSSFRSNGLIYATPQAEIANRYAIEGGGWESTSEDAVLAELFFKEYPNPTESEVSNFDGELPVGVKTLTDLVKFIDEMSSGANVMPVYMSIKKPMGSMTVPVLWRDLEKIGANGLIDRGFDGAYVQESGGVAFAVVKPNQIKSAIGNCGDFDPKNPNITK